MLRSHDTNGSLPMDMGSLGLMDLDLSLSPDVFGLRAFDQEKPITRMLPGSTPCKLRLMLPDSQLGTDGFHDVIIDNLAASPADITARKRLDRAFHHSAPGFCVVCDVRVDSALDAHMIAFQLELAQLWRCPVE